MAPLSILIVGCGVAGPTLASFLLSTALPAREKPTITILERAQTPRAQGQNVDIRGAGMTVARKLGLDTVIRSSTTQEEGARFVDEYNRTWAEFGADKSGRVQTGTSDVEILRGCLADICFRRSKVLSDEAKTEGGGGVEYIFGDYLDEVDQDGRKVHVRFAKSGEKRTFDLLVGADGVQSRTRRMVFGKEVDDNSYKQLGMHGGFFSMPKGETDSLWRRWFHTVGKRGIMVRPSDRADRTTVFIYVINDTDPRLEDVATSGSKGVREQKALLAEYFRDAGWECDRIIREMETADDFYYTTVAQVKMDKWSKGRVVLLGDAGYCASPVSGMGTTLALTGAYNLAGALANHPDDPMAAFAQYEHTMRPVAALAQRLPIGGRGVFVFPPESAWGVWLMRTIVASIYWSGITLLAARFVGPPANAVPVEEYGFKQSPEWQG